MDWLVTSKSNSQTFHGLCSQVAPPTFSSISDLMINTSSAYSSSCSSTPPPSLSCTFQINIQPSSEAVSRNWSSLVTVILEGRDNKIIDKTWKNGDTILFYTAFFSLSTYSLNFYPRKSIVEIITHSHYQHFDYVSYSCSTPVETTKGREQICVDTGSTSGLKATGRF